MKSFLKLYQKTDDAVGKSLRKCNSLFTFYPYEMRLGNIILLTPLKINYKTQKILNTKKLVKIL